MPLLRLQVKNSGVGGGGRLAPFPGAYSLSKKKVIDTSTHLKYFIRILAFN